MLASQLIGWVICTPIGDRHLRFGISQRAGLEVARDCLGPREAQPGSSGFAICDGSRLFRICGTQTELLQIWQQNQHHCCNLPQHRVHSKGKSCRTPWELREGLKTALKIKEDYRARRPILMPDEHDRIIVPETMMTRIFT